MEKIECRECGRKFKTSDALNQHKSDVHSKQETAVIKTSKLSFGKILTYGIVFLVVVGIGYALVWALGAQPTGNSVAVGPAGSTHIHQDFKVYINGEAIDFSQSKYQKPHLNARVHLEGGDGDLIHKHATGVTVGFFLKSLGIEFDKNCLTMDTGERYCNDGDKTLKFYANGKPNDQWENYDLRNLDKILVSYGNESEKDIEQQLASITDKAKQQ